VNTTSINVSLQSCLPATAGCRMTGKADCQKSCFTCNWLLYVATQNALKGHMVTSELPSAHRTM
jgi:hypothetical protein